MGGSGEPATATVTLPGGETLSLPLLTDAAGGRFLDVRGLYASSGLCCFDPGFGSTASCESAITFIDGAAGLLLYRGAYAELCRLCAVGSVSALGSASPKSWHAKIDEVEFLIFILVFKGIGRW